MFDWRGFRFHRLIQVPRPPESRDEQGGADQAGPLAASLTGAHADLRAAGTSGAAVLTAWIRSPQDERLHFLYGGRPYFPPAIGVTGRARDGTTTRALLFPPGALATDISIGDTEKLLAPFLSWVPCQARADALWAPAANKQERPTARRGSFDRHVAHMRGPFAWLVLAEPLLSQELEPELRSLVNEILPLSRGEVGEAKRVELERKQARHRELSRAAAGGGWRIRVLVGSIDPRGATTAAAMLCAASELADLPYVLEPAGPPVAVPDLRRATFTSGTELLAALSRPPDRELPGLRLVEQHGFDVTPEQAGDGAVRLGAVLDEGLVEVGDLVLGRESLNRHTFVCGATGAGKSQTVRHLLAQASRAGLPWLVVEPAKAEYARMAGRLADLGQDVIVIRPGDPDSAPAGFNPLEPAPGFPLQSHADLLRALFLAAFEAQEPFPQILAAALTRCYEELGWDLSLGEPIHGGRVPRYPTLADLQRVAVEVVTEIGYGREIAANVQGFIKVRLSSLRLGTAGRFFEGGHPLSFERLCRGNVVLQIEDVGDDADKAFLMGAVLMRLSEHLRVAARATVRPGLTHLTVIEEAHRLLRRSEPGTAGPATHAVEMFAALLAEVRAYGEGLIIAEQIPSKLTPDVIKNTAVKIVHRLPAKDDRDSVGATMNVTDDQSRYLVTLVPGEGAVFTDGMDRPLLVRVPDGSLVEDTRSGTIAPVDRLIGRRSGTCGTDCRAQACTLRQLRAAAHLLTAEPWLVVWAEFAVLAHLTGQPTPVPTSAVRTALVEQALPARTVDCALSHAVDEAVAVRSSVLQPTVDPAALAIHVRTALAHMLGGGPRSCQADELAYLATPFRWELVRRALDAARDDGRDHRSARWEAQFRRKIDGDTRVAQLQAVRAWLISDLADTAAVDSVSFGTRRPSAIEVAIGTAPEGRTERLKSVLEQFIDCSWPLIHFGADAQPGGDRR
ncbi:ATP-binding protein [Plantactinospora sp. S1510]|uniref:ATP-binding protein n=1 Tax=Plantactinospora alkalitolerans TaxID=2789879 RepID=A0ABS0GVV0_9ACTN|nr:ATP-binding protein [Plantactinospora alkalitolerans]MBF9130316.1 ATP-binding protein [Plantactinospora alkalitolerans]